MRWTAHFLCYGLLALGWSAARSQQPARIRRVYVHPFAIQRDANKLRHDVIDELRKVDSISIVSIPATADITLTGSGEIWVRGYVSLNPRSGRLPADGTPLYGGYLSVELKNNKGDTIWSYLATPSAPTRNIEKEFSKEITDHLAAALNRAESTAPEVPVTAKSTTYLHGAGSTFSFPIYDKWFRSYRQFNPRVQITYDPIGSETGIRRMIAGAVDFGATDSPKILAEIAPSRDRDYLFLPSVIGAVVPIIHLQGYSSSIRFTPEILAGIYLGEITKWDDPLLTKANPRRWLPHRSIVPIHRADGSGTSFTFTDYLSNTVPEWRRRIGSGTSPGWPVGRGAHGNEGVAEVVQQIDGTIGYVEYIFALKKHLAFASVRNRNGKFVYADLDTIASAAAHSAALGTDLTGSIVNPPGDDAYPIASFTWLVIPSHFADPEKRAALVHFLEWMLSPGQRQAAALGYVSLPTTLVSRERAALGTLAR